MNMNFTGSMPEVFNNSHGLYSGHLRDYFSKIMEAPNAKNGYHNIGHLLHVAYVCHEGLQYYHNSGDPLTQEDGKALLIAALFHDYDHTGRAGPDSVNIDRALDGMQALLHPDDTEIADQITDIIKATEFPHTELAPDSPLTHRIIRDADVSQAFFPRWIGDVVAGLGDEQNKTPEQMLNAQAGFLQNLTFASEFGEATYGRRAIDAKLAETAALLALLR